MAAKNLRASKAIVVQTAQQVGVNTRLMGAARHQREHNMNSTPVITDPVANSVRSWVEAHFFREPRFAHLHRCLIVARP